MKSWKIGLLLLPISWLLFNPASAKDVNSSPAWATSDSYLGEVRQIAVYAAKLLWLAAEPTFRGNGLYATGGIPVTGHVSIAILFPTRLDTPQYLEGSQTLTFCKTILPNPSNGRADYVIACDPESIREFEILVRLSHSQKFVDKYMRNDWSVIGVLDRIKNDPVSLVNEVGPIEVSDEHIREHVALLLAFLYAHEVYHLTHGSSEAFDDAPNYEFTREDGEVKTLEMCRNYKEFIRQGRKFFSDPAEPLAEEEGAAKSPLLDRALAPSRQEWAEELDADRYAASELVKIISKIKEGGADQPELEGMFLDVLFNFGNLTLLKWQSKMSTIAYSMCQNHAGEDYYLSRCMAERTSNYSIAQTLLSSTHPAIALRMDTAAKSFIDGIGQQGIIKSGLLEIPRLVTAMSWYFLVDSMEDTPMKIALVQCTQLQDKAASITQIFPDLAGYFGAGRSDKYPGYPTDEQALFGMITAARKNKK